MKDSFILYTEQKEVVDKLTDEQAGKLFKAIYEYAETEQMPQLDSLLDIVIIPFKQSMDRNTEKWEETKQKRREAGKIGAEKRWKNNKDEIAKMANANFANSKIAKMAVNVNVPVPVNVNDNVTTTVVNNVNDSCVDGLQKIFDFYNQNIGLIAPYGAEILKDYSEEMSPDLIILAMKKAVESNKRTIQYIKGILNNWSKKGIKTVLDAEREDEQFRNKNTVQEETKEEKMKRKLKALEEAMGNE